MTTTDLATTMTILFGELVDGAERACYVLNSGDVGLLRSLDKVSAAAASQAATGATIAAHVDHLRYGLSLLNRWAAGENAWADADWSASWRITSVSEPQWEQLRAKLSTEAHRALTVLSTPRDVSQNELNGMVGAIAHLAYHLGAIRQIHKAIKGPAESSAQ